MVVKIRKRSDGIHFQTGDQGCFGRVGFGDEHPPVSIGAGRGGHRQDAARVTDNAVKGEFADDQRVFHRFGLQTPGKDDHAESDGQVVGRSLLADGGGRQVDNDAVAGEVQAGVLDSGLDALAALLHGGVGQADDDDGGQAVGIVHFDLDDDTFKSHNRTGVYARKHGGSLDEEEGNVNRIGGKPAGKRRKRGLWYTLLRTPKPACKENQVEFSNKTMIYDSAKRVSPALEELRGIFQYRDLIYQLVRRDIVTRYKRSILGIAWTMLQPLGMMIVMTIVFSNLFRSVEGYPAYILSGLIAWTFFAQTTTATIHQVVWGGTLFRRIYLPHTSFAVSAVSTGVVNLALSLVPLLAIILFTGRSLYWSMLFIPVAMAILAAFALGVGLILSALGVYFPDVVEMYQIVLVAWMYLTPIIYPEEILPAAYRAWVTNLNPMYHMIQIFRQPLYDGTLPAWNEIGIAALIASVTLAVGWLFFANKADEFAYRA